MAVTSANGIDIYYERRGEGPRLLFLNGSGATLAASAELINVFTAQFDLVAHDQRGLGQTSIPPGPYTMAQYAADAAAVLDEVGWDRCRVVGVSFGGMVAQEFAVTYPERVERLALLCTSPGGAGGSSYPIHELANRAEDDGGAGVLRLLDTRFTAEWLAAHPEDKLIVERRIERAATPKSAEQRRGEVEQLEARRYHDVFDRLPAIACPTFVACGRYDGIAPPQNSEAIVSRIAAAELHQYEGGHLFFAQDRAALPEVLDFLGAGRAPRMRTEPVRNTS